MVASLSLHVDHVHQYETHDASPTFGQTTASEPSAKHNRETSISKANETFDQDYQGIKELVKDLCRKITELEDEIRRSNSSDFYDLLASSLKSAKSKMRDLEFTLRQLEGHSTSPPTKRQNRSPSRPRDRSRLHEPGQGDWRQSWRNEVKATRRQEEDIDNEWNDGKWERKDWRIKLELMDREVRWREEEDILDKERANELCRLLERLGCRVD